MKTTRKLFFGVMSGFILLFLGDSFAQTKPIPEDFREYIEREQKLNDHFRKKGIFTDVDKKYLPYSGEVFELPYIEVPLSDLHLVDSGITSKSIKKQLFVTKYRKKYMRYFIHPESIKLYEPMIKKYPIKGKYLATPTSSTRTLLTWNPDNPSDEPLFIKVSLDKVQFGWGRSVPDHEVRRSVITSKQIASMSPKMKEKNKLDIMPEVLGAYVDKKWGMNSWIHKSQGGFNPQHGMVVRDPANLFKNGQGKKIYPAFSLFAEREIEADGKKTMGEPIIIEWWKKSGLSWKDFIGQNFLDPVLEGTSYMTMYEGYLPEMHTQNFLVQVNPETLKVEKVIHRDVGGIRHVDLQVRLTNGLGIEGLKSQNPSKDFRFADATKTQQDPYFNWLYPYLFNGNKGFAETLKKYVPDYNEAEMRALMMEILKKHALKHLRARKVAGINSGLQKFVKKFSPNIKPMKNLTTKQLKNLEDFVLHQIAQGQVMSLDDFSYDPKFKDGDFLKTSYGVFYKNSSTPNMAPKLAFYSTDDAIPCEGGQQSSSLKTLMADLSKIPNIDLAKGQKQKLHQTEINLVIKEMNVLTKEINELVSENNANKKNDQLSKEQQRQLSKENKEKIKPLQNRKNALRLLKEKLIKNQES